MLYFHVFYIVCTIIYFRKSKVQRLIENWKMSYDFKESQDQIQKLKEWVIIKKSLLTFKNVLK
jgi:hypothetical protein